MIESVRFKNIHDDTHGVKMSDIFCGSGAYTETKKYYESIGSFKES